MLADNTYTSYCSHWRKYKRMMRETEGTPEFKYWENQLTGVEIRILNGGREIPKEKDAPPVVIPNTQKTPGSPLPAATSADVASARKAYDSAKKLGDVKMIARFAERLRELGEEVDSALSETKTA
jgi:hypothetical protein